MSLDHIRVVIADDHAVVRAGVKALLRPAPDIEIVGEASNGLEAVAMVRRLKPEVLILDLSMPQLGGLEAARELLTDGLSTGILLLTMHEPDDHLVPLLEAGVRGFLQKSAVDRELTDAVRAVANGDVYLQTSAAQVLAGERRRRSEPSEERDRYDRLTPREREVLLLVAQGFTAPEIGERLDISPKTVDTYKQRIHDKAGLAHRPDYVKLALSLGLLHEG